MNNRSVFILTVLTGLNLFNYLDRYVLSAVLTPIKVQLNLSDGQLGRIATVFMLGYFLSSPFFGYCGDRFSRKWLIALGVLVWSLGTVFSGLATGLGGLIFFRILVGFGEASYATISPGLISDSIAPEKRNSALTIFYVAIPVGAALGYIVGGQVSAIAGWRSAFFWAGGPGLLLALLLLPLREPQRGEAEGGFHQTSFKKVPSLRDIFGISKIKEYNLTVRGYTAYTFAMGAYAYWGPTFLCRSQNIPYDKASAFFGAVLVGAGFLGTLVGGFWATAWHKENPAAYAMVLGFSVLAAVPVTAGALLLHGPHLVMGLLATATFLLFLPTGPVNTLIIQSVPVHVRSSAMALSIFRIHLFGDMFSPEIVGRFADLWKNLSAGLLILPLALAIAAFLWIRLALFQVQRLSAFA